MRNGKVKWGIKGAVLQNVLMKRYASMRVGGPVSYLIYPVNEEDLSDTIRVLHDEHIRYRFVGNATNIIVNDRGLEEAVIRITRMRSSQQKKVKDGAFVEVSGGASLKGFIKNNAEKGLAGLERLYWIPGTVGGGVKMNAGSFDASISDVLEEVRIVDNDGKAKSFTKKDMFFDYRTSPIKPSECIVSATFYLKNRDKKEISVDMDYVYTERRKRHPMEYPSSGSIFKSVNGAPAWQFVEKAGLRGFKIGDACVSEKHTNFIINAGHATAKDVKMLIDAIKKTVFERIGISLEEEVELWGFDE
jgi:UDP-N-acetylmuramate dehydrogenase